VTFGSAGTFNPHATYRMGAGVVLRSESFGALAYDLNTKRLLVLNDRDLVTVLERLHGFVSVTDAVDAVAPGKRQPLLSALARLERDGVIHVV
jgi:putative mycofactocin binding protein MftB